MMQILKFKTTLKCSGCVAAIKPKMDQLKNVKKWDVDLTQPIKILTVEGVDVDEKEVIALIKQAGFDLNKI
jgi:copper chaperone